MRASIIALSAFRVNPQTQIRLQPASTGAFGLIWNCWRADFCTSVSAAWLVETVGKKIAAEQANVDVTARHGSNVAIQMRTNVTHIVAMGDRVGTHTGVKDAAPAHSFVGSVRADDIVQISGLTAPCDVRFFYTCQQTMV